LSKVISKTHGTDYLDHLETAFSLWLRDGLIEEDGSILPECFIVPNRTGVTARPPKDVFARPGYYAFDMSSGITRHTWASTLASANLAAVATQRLYTGSSKATLALTRPPGHHCTGRQAGGYCYVNNAAVAVSTWRQQSPDADIAILDVDFHHGNGTQDIFYEDKRVLYVSIHGEDEFPYYTGREDETGSGDGKGSNINLPLPTGSSFASYLHRLEPGLDAVVHFRPNLLLVSLGFDTFRLDPLGTFQIDTPDYETLAHNISKRLPGIPVLILLEGGYVIEHLGPNLLSFLKGWEAATP
jgi:acetoin utilization deacetylase AcuC-like enzyme